MANIFGKFTITNFYGDCSYIHVSIMIMILCHVLQRLIFVSIDDCKQTQFFIIIISRSLRTFDQSDASSHQVTSSESMEIYITDLIIAMYIEYGGV